MYKRVDEAGDEPATFFSARSPLQAEAGTELSRETIPILSLEDALAN